MSHAPPSTRIALTAATLPSGGPAFPAGMRAGDTVSAFAWPSWSWINMWMHGSVTSVLADGGGEVQADFDCGECVIVAPGTHQPGLTNRAI